MDGKEPFRKPYSAYYLEHPESCWPAGKFGMDMTDAWTSLPREFNCITIPLLAGDAFRKDVSYLSTIARDRAEFLTLLKERRDMRQKELTTMWNRTFTHLCTYPTALEYKPGDREDGHWPEAMSFAQWKSFDTLIGYFASFLPLSKQDAKAIAPEIAPTPAPIEPTTPPADTASDPQLPRLPAPDREQVKDTAKSTALRQQPRRGIRETRSGGVQKPVQQGLRRSGRLQQKTNVPQPTLQKPYRHQRHRRAKGSMSRG